MTTINDIAKLAGVAKSTVSRHLNGCSVSRNTAAKIEAVIKQTGYVPNSFAQSLKAKESRMIGVIIPRLDSFSANCILSEIDEVFRQHNYQVLIINSNFSVSREEEALRTFQVNKMDGVIFLMSHTDNRIIELLENVQVPIVTIGQEFLDENTIYYDEESAGRQLADYLYAMGHRDMDFLTVTTTDPAVGIKRRDAIKREFLKYGDTSFREYSCGFNLMDGYQVTRDQVLLNKPRLIVGATDIIAIGAMRACLEAGYQVPEQINFAGFGNNVLGSSIYPGLTTVEYPYRHAGYVATKMLLDRIQGQGTVTKRKLETSLVIRQSVTAV